MLIVHALFLPDLTFLLRAAQMSQLSKNWSGPLVINFLPCKQGIFWVYFYFLWFFFWPDADELGHRNAALLYYEQQQELLLTSIGRMGQPLEVACAFYCFLLLYIFSFLYFTLLFAFYVSLIVTSLLVIYYWLYCPFVNNKRILNRKTF